jgi:hypothetical protein
MTDIDTELAAPYSLPEAASAKAPVEKLAHVINAKVKTRAIFPSLFIIFSYPFYFILFFI